MKNKIISINVDQIGHIGATPENPIEVIVTPIELGHNWYKRGNEEYNGKYVIRVVYEPDCKCSCHIKGLNGTHHEENCLCHDSDSITKGRIL